MSRTESPQARDLAGKVYDLLAEPGNQCRLGEQFRAFMLEAAARREWPEQKTRARETLRDAAQAIAEARKAVQGNRKPPLVDPDTEHPEGWEWLGVYLDPHDLDRGEDNYREGWWPPGAVKAQTFLGGLAEALRLWPGPNPTPAARLTLLARFHDACSDCDKILEPIVKVAKDHDAAEWASRCALAWCREAVKGDAGRLAALGAYLKQAQRHLATAGKPNGCLVSPFSIEGSWDPDSRFLEDTANEVHRLFFPPQPPTRMQRFREQVQAAIKQQQRHDAAREKMVRHRNRVWKDPRLRNRKKRPPGKGWTWDDEVFPETPGPADTPIDRRGAWVPRNLPSETTLPPGPIPNGGVPEPEDVPTEIILAGQYVILAIVHDNNDSDPAARRGRDNLLTGIRLPPALALFRDRGPGSRPSLRVSGFDRPSIERALQDVKADLAKVDLAAAEKPKRKQPTPTTPPPVTPPKRRPELDEPHQRVRVNGKWYDLTDEQTRLLSLLFEAEGSWIQGRQLSEGRPDKIIKAMRKPVQKIIESRKGTGYGYRLPAFLPE